MRTQSWLIDCGSTVFIYDSQEKRRRKTYSDEERIKKITTELEYLLLNNFEYDRHSALFTLKTSIADLEEIPAKLDFFIKQLKHASGYKHIKYLAVIESNEHCIFLQLITNVEHYELTSALEKRNLF